MWSGTNLSTCLCALRSIIDCISSQKPFTLAMDEAKWNKRNGLANSYLLMLQKYVKGG